MKRILIIAVVSLALLTGVYVAYKALVAGGLSGSPRKPVTATVAAQTIRSELRLIGEVQPENQVEVRSEVNGQAEKVFFDVGDKVKENDLLVQLDEKNLLIEQRRLQIDLSNAVLSAEFAKRDHESLLSVKNKGEGYASGMDILQKQTDYELAQNEIKSLNINIEDVEDRLKKVRIRSPISGTVIERKVQPGEVVTGVQGVSGGTVILKIADLDKLIVNTQVNEVDLHKIKVAQEGWAESYMVKGIRLKCLIETIAPIAVKGDRGARFLTVKVKLMENDPRIRPGMSADVVFILAQADEVPAVPVQALFNKGDKKIVYVLRPETPKPEEREVTLGVTDAKYAQIETGVSLDEVVMLEKPGDLEPAIPEGKLVKTDLEKKTDKSANKGGGKGPGK